MEGEGDPKIQAPQTKPESPAADKGLGNFVDSFNQHSLPGHGPIDLCHHILPKWTRKHATHPQPLGQTAQRQVAAPGFDEETAREKISR